MRIRLTAVALVAILPLAVACGSSSSTPAGAPAATGSATTEATQSAAPDATATASASSQDADASAAEQECGDLTKPDTEAALPAGFPAVDGFTGIGEVKQGSTTAIKGSVDGGPDEIVSVRDAGLAKLKAAGYALGDHDQEEGAEADGDFTGTHDGNINVRNLCKDHLVVTYTLNS